MQGHSAPPATSTTHQLVAQPRKVRLSFRKRSTDVEKAAQHDWRFATTVTTGKPRTPATPGIPALLIVARTFLARDPTKETKETKETTETDRNQQGLGVVSCVSFCFSPWGPGVRPSFVCASFIATSASASIRKVAIVIGDRDCTTAGSQFPTRAQSITHSTQAAPRSATAECTHRRACAPTC